MNWKRNKERGTKKNKERRIQKQKESTTRPNSKGKRWNGKEKKMMPKNVKGKGKTRIQYAAIQRNGLLTRTYSIIIISDSLYNYVSCRLSSFSVSNTSLTLMIYSLFKFTLYINTY